MSAASSKKQPPLMTSGQLITAFIFSNILFLILGMAIGKGDFSSEPQAQEAISLQKEEIESSPQQEGKIEEFYSLEKSSDLARKDPIDLSIQRKSEPKIALGPRPVEKEVPTDEAIKNPPPDEKTKPAPISQQNTEPQKKPAESAAQSGEYYIQLSASQDQQQIHKFLAIVKAKGYPAIMVKEGAFYKVQLGNYPSRDKAERMKVDIDKALNIQSWIKSR